MPNKVKTHKPPYLVKARAARDKQAAKTTSERYGYEWRKFRKSILADNPLCQDCLREDIYTEASDVHHIVAVRIAPERILDPSNMMPLCKSCHSVRTARGE